MTGTSATPPDPARLRAWWSHRQGLDARTGRAPAEVLADTGWARSVGGANPYVTLFARAGISRADADAAVARLDVHELPSARGCTYVLPRDDYALGLTLARPAARAALKVLVRLGVGEAEVERLAGEVLAVLDGAAGPMDPRALRKALGGAVRDLGEEGRKKGASSTLPAALGLLQADGEIRRVPADGRLDQQRYGYVRWSGSPAVPDAGAELARRYWRWTGPTSVAQFRWFSGFGAREAKAALSDVDLRPVAGTELLVAAGDAEEFAAFGVPRRPSYALIAWIDALVLLRRDLPSLIDPADAEVPLLGRRLGSLSDLATQAIVDRGRIVGLWERRADRLGRVHRAGRRAAGGGRRHGVVRTGTTRRPARFQPRFARIAQTAHRGDPRSHKLRHRA